MTEQKDEIRREASRMVNHYAPLFQKHGVLLDFHLRHFKQFVPEYRSTRMKLFDDVANAIGRLLRKVFTGKESPRESEESMLRKVWCIVLHFQDASNKKRTKEYSLIFQYKNQHGTMETSVKRTLRAAERIILRKLRLLEKQDAQTLCTDTWWDAMRYAYGNYDYKESAMGWRAWVLRLCPIILVFVLLLLVEIILL